MTLFTGVLERSVADTADKSVTFHRQTRRPVAYRVSLLSHSHLTGAFILILAVLVTQSSNVNPLLMLNV